MADELGTFNEKNTPVYYGLIKDDLGLVLDMTAVDSFTLSLYEESTEAIVNARSTQDVKNLNGVSVYATAQSVTIDGVAISYNVKWPTLILDNAIVGTRSLEKHIGVFTTIWASGTKRDDHEMSWLIRNLKKVA
jgi:hypothetical protein